MQNIKCDISKRDFLKKSLAFSAGLICFPHKAILSEMTSEQQGIYRKIAM